MKKTRILSLLLCLSIFCTLIVPGTRAYAESAPDNGMKISKTATANQDGSYTITLEAFATGAKVISDVTKDVPTDIILVLDQSGSMAYDIGTVSFKQYEDETNWRGDVSTYHTRNQDYYEYRHNGGSANLWHKLPDGSYVSVSVTKTTEYKDLNIKLPNFSYRNECYWDYANNLYEKVGEEYKKVTLTYAYSYAEGDYVFTYTFSDGSSITSVGTDTSPDLGNHSPLYTPVADGNNTVYTYTYTDKDGNVQIIGTSTGAETVFSPTLYERVTDTTGGGSRLNALKSAATSFANQVATKANGTDGIAGTDDDVKHRIAVVGYADSSSNLTNGFKQMNNTSQAAEVSSAIDNLTADGGTHIDQGLSTANGIFANNPIGDTENRNRVVIVFTDGAPGTYGNWRSESVQTANNAIAYAKTAKKPTSEGGYGATVYTIGIFSGADASNPDSLPAYTSYTTGRFGNEQSPSEADQVKNSNRFMHLVSSNYPAASSITQPGSINPNLNGKSYYLSAADSGSLNNIFQQISDQIETGGSSSTLTSDAVVKDIISPQFTLPEGATASSITLETYRCTGKNGSDYTWSKNTDAMGAKASISGDQVNVTGFNFSENYVGTVTENGNTSYRGNKLVIRFTVKPKTGFLGGNDVYTNSSAGIYENGTAESPLLEFEKPTVNVPIKPVTVDAKDKNVYLKGSVTTDQLKSDATVKVGDVSLDLTKDNYGLADWQTEYVNITVTVKDKDGNPISDKLDNLTDDTNYTVTVTVSPKTTEPKSTEGTKAEKRSGSSKGKINVFKPELTFKDSTAYYGDTAPTDSSGNLTNTEWKHGETKSTDSGVTMIGTAPTLDLTYTPEAGKIAGGKINTKEDISVDVSVKIGTDDVTDETSFVHTKCDETCTDPANGKFWIHVKTCTLSITKQGGADNESYVFDVFKDGEKYSEVTVWGNGTETLVELPVGDYTIVENTGWSWRYTANNGGSAALTAQSPTGSITCTNTKTNDQWLNGFSTVVRNIFGFKH